MLHIYNTLTRKKERFKPLRQEKVKIYYCGPTVYNYAHIGNFRGFLFDDIVVKAIRFLGFKVETTMNITDIEDKIIRDSQKSGMSIIEFTEKYTEIFFDDMKKLNIAKADNVIPISHVIPEMVEITNVLLDKGYAYLADDNSIYYSIKKFQKYGKFAQLDMKGMKSGVRINNDEYEKEDVGDFALWKAYDETKDGDIFWEEKFVIDGEEKVVKGRPGWHIECSALAYKTFGKQIDLHMGGIDLIFPHHQNEIAQSEAFTGKEFSKYWMHNGHLLVDNQKMSKSKNNFYRLEDMVNHKEMKREVKENVYRGFRLMALQNTYRDSFNFSFSRLKAAVSTIKSFDETFKRIKHYKPSRKKVSRQFREVLQQYIFDYVTSLEDDINTVEALVTVFEFNSYVNSGIDNNDFSDAEINSIIDLYKTFNDVLGVLDFEIFDTEEIIPDEVQMLLDERIEAKNSKDFETSDKIRGTIEKMGYKIIDDKNGMRVEKI